MFFKRFLKVGAFFALLSCLVLGTALFTGCQQDGDDSVTPVSVEGKWVAGYGDNFVIQNGILSYYGDSTTTTPAYKGVIRHRKDFNTKSGVLIIEYTSDGKPQYYEYGGPPSYAIISGPVEPLGNFQGVYFNELTTASGEFAAAASNQSPYGDKYSRVEKTSLADAINAFTLDNVDKYVSSSPTYAKQ